VSDQATKISGIKIACIIEYIFLPGGLNSQFYNEYMNLLALLPPKNFTVLKANFSLNIILKRQKMLLAFASSNSYASFMLSKLPAIHL